MFAECLNVVIEIKSRCPVVQYLHKTPHTWYELPGSCYQSRESSIRNTLRLNFKLTGRDVQSQSVIPECSELLCIFSRVRWHFRALTSPDASLCRGAVVRLHNSREMSPYVLDFVPMMLRCVGAAVALEIKQVRLSFKVEIPRLS